MHNILCITDNHRHMFLSTFIGYSCTKLHFQHFVIIFSSFLHIIIGFTYKHILCVSQSTIRTNTFFSVSLLVFQAHNFQRLLNMYSIYVLQYRITVYTFGCSYTHFPVLIWWHFWLLEHTIFCASLLVFQTHISTTLLAMEHTILWMTY